MTVKQSDKISIIQQWLSDWETDTLVCQYGALLLELLPLDIVHLHDQAWWHQFLVNRLTHIQDAVQDGSGIWVHAPSQAQINQAWGLDIVYPDADKLFFTLQTVIRECDLRVTVSLHPMISIQVDSNGCLTDIARPHASSTRVVSSVYIEFERLPDTLTIQDLQARIAMHMAAVQVCHQAQSAIAHRVSDIQSAIGTIDGASELEKTEWSNLLTWLGDNFFYYGYECFDIVGANPQSLTATPVAGTQLGILSDDYRSIDTAGIHNALQRQVNKKLAHPHLFYFDRIQARSPIQRFALLMRLSFKVKQSDGHWHDHNFLGILRRSSLNVKNLETPLIHLKMKYIFDARQLLPGSYNHYEVIRLFMGIPKFELFRSSKETLLDMVDSMMSIINPNRVRCFIHEKPAFNTVCFFVYVPFHVYTPANCAAIQDYLKQAVGTDCDMEVVDIFDVDKPRLHIYFESKQPLPSFDFEGINHGLNQRIQPWSTQVKQLFEQQGIADAVQDEWVRMMPTDYQARTTPKQAVHDCLALTLLSDSKPVDSRLTRFLTPDSHHDNKVSLLSIYTKTKLRLYDMLPILENLGLLVLDQLTTRFRLPGSVDDGLGYVQSYRLMTKAKEPLDEPVYQEPLADVIGAIFRKEVQNDGLNQLVLNTQLNYRDVNVLRTYCQLYAQLQPMYAKGLTHILNQYPDCTEQLARYFIAKFNPELAESAQDRAEQWLPDLEQQFFDLIKPIQNLSDDRVFRELFMLVQATARTNAYQHDRLSGTAIAIKIHSHGVPFMPKPTPWVEIYVQDTFLDGVHLRFGPVSRGGLRWSSRPNDFRTEILGLVKAQTLKNVLIVPDGSKGGFVVRMDSDVDDTAAFVQSQYQRFIAALLDVTDNKAPDGSILPPKHCVLYDADDPYLVVAADKGTATFSDLANAVSSQYNFWLGDAFASGGQAGYDHKKEGITARGAWECVKLHCMDRGVDCQRDPVTVVGIGDMSGDVFGNGLLRSESVRLLAAFNHCHIFVDPTPDPAISYAERKRLFELPRSSWTDYQADCISSGGGVFDRDAKAIAITPEMKQVFGIESDVLSGVELIQAVLSASVDLIWFGGIGTYIKGMHERHSTVGDPANDDCRIDAQLVRASVIGEGANLGITEAAREELSLRGVALNTDAIDNSAGVNMSDYEVNLKILCQQLLADGVLASDADRNQLLGSIVDEVSELCLQNNRAQHRSISLDSRRANQNLTAFRQAILDLRRIDESPEAQAIEATILNPRSTGLTRPMLSVFQAKIKHQIIQQVSEDWDANHPLFQVYLEQYFPQTIADTYLPYIHQHPLAGRISAMQVVNHVINHAGCGAIPTMVAQTGQDCVSVLQLYCLAYAIMGVCQSPELEAWIRHEKRVNTFVYEALMYGDYAAILASTATHRVTAKAINDATDVPFFLLIQLVENQGMPVNDANQWLMRYDHYFGFSRIQEYIQGMPIDTKWSWVKQSMMTASLSRYRHALLNPVAEQWPTETAWLPEHWGLLQDYQAIVQDLNDRSGGSSDIIDVVLAKLATLVHAMQVHA